MPAALPDVAVIAHRGASRDAPEHTLAAYDLAVAQGADALELDVRATADGELVVLHDPTLRRTCGDPRAVAQLTAGELDALDGPRTPLRLDAVLARYGRAVDWLVELKHPDQGWERTVPALLERHGLLGHAVVQSFDARALRRLRRYRPALAVAPLFEAATPADLRRSAGWAVGVGVRHGAIDRGLMAAASELGLGVRGWTANAPGDIARLFGLGVQGVITDLPELARELVARRAAPALAA